MKPVSTNCPNCGTPINLDIDHLSQFCNSCGAKIVLDVETIQQLLIAKEETKRAQMDADKQVKLAQMQSEGEAKKVESHEKIKTRSFMFQYGLPIIFSLVVMIIIGVVLAWASCSTDRHGDKLKAEHESRVEKLEDIEDELEEALEAGDYDHALILANKLRLDDHWSSEENESWDERREEYMRIIKERQQANESN